MSALRKPKEKVLVLEPSSLCFGHGACNDFGMNGFREEGSSGPFASCHRRCLCRQAITEVVPSSFLFQYDEVFVPTLWVILRLHIRFKSADNLDWSR